MVLEQRNAPIVQDMVFSFPGGFTIIDYYNNDNYNNYYYHYCYIKLTSSEIPFMV